MTNNSIFLLLTFSLFSLFTAKNVSAQLPAGVKKITSVEGITEYRLTNGLRVLLFPDKSKPTATVNITYLVGSRHEGYGETGMAHLLEHMVFKGTPNHPDIPSELTEHGCRPNGTTWLDRTNYFETFSASDENLRWALELEADRMVNSNIAKKDLETEMTVVRNEFESGENDPTSILQERVVSTAYLWHNYGNSTIGARSDIEEVPIERLQAFYHKYYQPDNAVLTVVGQFEKEKTLKWIAELYGKIPRPDREISKIYPTYTKEPTQDGERSVTLRRVGDAKVVSCLYHISSGVNPDHAAVRVLSRILTDEPSGRLYKALVETKKASWLWGWAASLKEPGFLYLNVNVRKENSLEEAKKVLLTTLDEFLKTPPTKEEVERAKTQILKSWNLNFKKADRVGVFISNYIAMGDWRLLFLARDRVEKVTVEDVMAVAKKYLKPSNRTVGMFFPEQKPDRSEIPETPDVAAMVKDYKGKAAISEGEEFDLSPENINQRTTVTQAGNGMKLALLNKETRGDAVALNIQLHLGDLNTLQGKADIGDFTASMLDKGTKHFTRQQIEDKLDALKARMMIWGGASNVNVRIETEHKYLPQVLDLISEILQQPTFPEEEFEKLKEEELAWIESQQSEPQAVAGREYQRLMAPYPKGDPRHTGTFEEDIESMKNLKLEDVKKFYRDFYGASDATISVVGDFDEKTVKAKLLNTFGSWKSPTKFVRMKPQFFEVKPVDKKINTPDKANAMFLAGQNIKVNVNDADYPALVLGNYILGGGFLNSRLATRIRQKEGISYGISSWLQAGDVEKVGRFGVYAIYAPENRERLEKAFREEIQRMLTDGFTPEEIEAAKSGWLQSQLVSRSNDGRLVTILNANLFYDRDMSRLAKLEKDVKNLTVQQINTAMKKYIDLSKISYIKAGDFEKTEKKNRP